MEPPERQPWAALVLSDANVSSISSLLSHFNQRLAIRGSSSDWVAIASISHGCGKFGLPDLRGCS
jgi:hypothetical protein